MKYAFTANELGAQPSNFKTNNKMKQILSEQFSLKWRDFFKGLIMAVGTPVLYLVQELIPGWDISPLAKAAIAAGVTYLLKNFFEPTTVITSSPSRDKIDSLKQ